jgi:hypothetical protein
MIAVGVRLNRFGHVAWGYIKDVKKGGGRILGSDFLKETENEFFHFMKRNGDVFSTSVKSFSEKITHASDSSIPYSLHHHTTPHHCRRCILFFNNRERSKNIAFDLLRWRNTV